MSQKNVITPRIKPSDEVADIERKVVGLIKACPELEVSQIVQRMSSHNDNYSVDCELNTGYALLRLWVTGRLTIEHKRLILTEE